MALFCAAIRRESVSLLRFPFRNHVPFSHLRFHQFVAWNIYALVLTPISSPTDFKKCPKYLTRETAHILIPSMRFLLISLVRKVFSFIWDTPLLFYLSFPLIWRCPLLIIPSTCNFPFLRVFWFFLDFVLLFLRLFVVFFSTSRYLHSTFSISTSIPISWVYIFIICIRFSNHFLFFASNLMSSVYIR